MVEIQWPATPAEERRRAAILRGCKAATKPGAKTAAQLEQEAQEWDEYQASLPYSEVLPPDEPFDERELVDEREAMILRFEESDEYRRLTE